MLTVQNRDGIRQLDGLDGAIPLSSLIEGGHELIFRCKHCGRQQRLDLQALARTHGPLTTLAYIRKTTQCNCR